MELITDNRTIRSKVKRPHRCSTDKTAKAQERTAVPVADGFLKHSFLPVVSEMPEELEDCEAVERDFFNSLSHLANLYGFEPEANTQLVYPCNIAAAWQQACYHVGQLAPKTGMAIVQNGEHPASIVTYQNYNTGTRLYYIPFRPLWELMQDKGRKPLTALLLSVFAYLYKGLAIPDYTKDDYSLYYTYAMLKEWYAEDGDMEKEDKQALLKACSLAKQGGKTITAKLSRPIHLRQFGKRLEAFTPTDKMEKELKHLAASFYGLYCRYPNRSLWNNMWMGLDEPLEEARISPDEYISFIWDNSDILIDDIMEHVNNDIGDKMVIDEPIALQFFDSAQQQRCHDLSFEAMLFPLLNDFIYVLNNL